MPDPIRRQSESESSPSSPPPFAGEGQDWAVPLPALSPLEEQVREFIFSAATTWEAQPGRKLDNEVSIIEFLRALKTDNLFPGLDQATVLKVRNVFAGLDLSIGASLLSVLDDLMVVSGVQRLSPKHSPSREALLKKAFAANSPEETARALEVIAARKTSPSFFPGLHVFQPGDVETDPDNWAVVTAIHYAIGRMIKRHIPPSATVYKGVTPDSGEIGNG